MPPANRPFVEGHPTRKYLPHPYACEGVTFVPDPNMVHCAPFVERVDYSKWIRWYPSEGHWGIFRPVTIDLASNCPFTFVMHDVYAGSWMADARTGSLTVGGVSESRPFVLDGATGAFDSPTVVVAFVVHDLICTKTDGGYAVPSYWARHRFYAELGKAQGANQFRMFIDRSFLMLFNKPYSIANSIRGMFKAK